LCPASAAAAAAFIFSLNILTCSAGQSHKSPRKKQIFVQTEMPALEQKCQVFFFNGTIVKRKSQSFHFSVYSRNYFTIF
jgi:hypothetical protein